MPAFIGDGLNVFDIREAVGITDVLVRDAERGRALVEVLGNEPAVLLRGPQRGLRTQGLPVVRHCGGWMDDNIAKIVRGDREP